MNKNASKTSNQGKGNGKGKPESRTARCRRRMREWQIRQHVARGLAYGVGSGAVSLLVVWVQTRY